MAIKERLFVTGALRFDDNSAFGKNFDATVYPKASVSWLLSDEPFFSKGRSSTPCGSAARYGVFGPAAGHQRRAAVLQPGRGQARRSGPHRRDLRQPGQRGPQARALRARSSWASTPPCSTTGSASSSPTSTRRPRTPWSSGTWTRPPERPKSSSSISAGSRTTASRWRSTPGSSTAGTSPGICALAGSVYDNTLAEIGDGVGEIVFGFGLQRHVQGYPLGGYWARPITGFDDANGDGIIAVGRSHRGGASQVPRPGACPTRKRRSTARSPCSATASASAPSSTTVAATTSTTRSSPSAAPRCSTAGAWWTGPPRWRSRPGPGGAQRGHRVGFLRAGLVHQAARAVAHLQRPDSWARRLPGQPAEPHAGGRGTCSPSTTTAASTRR